MNTTTPRQPRGTSYVLVGLQFCLSAAIVLSANFDFVYAVGFGVAAVGLLIGVWSVVAIGVRRVKAMPEPRLDSQLVTTGPYRLVRHPMYTALLLRRFSISRVCVTCACRKS